MSVSNSNHPIHKMREMVYNMLKCFYVLCIFCGFHARVQCEYIGGPQFESEWLLITAQTTSSVVEVQHGLGEVPGLVEVLVKAIDGPNKGFIFKAIGNSERDDDSPDMYGGVVYIYNEQTVDVMAPYGFNTNKGGAVIYTGMAPYWHGVNSQASVNAEIKVRCWTIASLPAPCFNVTNIYMRAGSPSFDDTYIELNHNHAAYPSMVKVRVKMSDGQDPGWYSDAQGVSLFSYNRMGPWYVTGGLKFAYNNETIRIWTSSHPEGAIFTRNDGWGHDRVIYGIATTGYVEIFAWCELETAYEETIPFGPAVPMEDLEIPFPILYTHFDDFVLTFMIEAVDGPNKGFLFEVGGSAMTNTYNLGQPCAYGGLIYAYNDTTIRIWRPDHATGAAVCIPDNMGFGTNSQASQNGLFRFRVYKPPSFQPAEVYKSYPLVCSHFQILGNDRAYNETAIDTQYNVTTLLACDDLCRQHYACVTYSYNKDTCQMFNTTNDSLFYTEINTQVWGLKAREIVAEHESPVYYGISCDIIN